MYKWVPVWKNEIKHTQVYILQNRVKSLHKQFSMACDQEVWLGRVSWHKELTEKDIRPSWNKKQLNKVQQQKQWISHASLNAQTVLGKVLVAHKTV